MDAQNAMQRLSLDVIMVAAYGVDPYSVDFKECEILDSLHYCFEEIFRLAPEPSHRLVFLTCTSINKLQCCMQAISPRVSSTFACTFWAEDRKDTPHFPATLLYSSP